MSAEFLFISLLKLFWLEFLYPSLKLQKKIEYSIFYPCSSLYLKQTSCRKSSGLSFGVQNFVRYIIINWQHMEQKPKEDKSKSKLKLARNRSMIQITTRSRCFFTLLFFPTKEVYFHIHIWEVGNIPLREPKKNYKKKKVQIILARSLQLHPTPSQ